MVGKHASFEGELMRRFGPQTASSPLPFAAEHEHARVRSQRLLPLTQRHVPRGRGGRMGATAAENLQPFCALLSMNVRISSTDSSGMCSDAPAEALSATGERGAQGRDVGGEEERCDG
ncbi:MAG: hypothetical protein M1826_001413 [Phylliscum demangeonii]|nr:MAG: hypothetical protein M1826_001413 [Phylliscum demangeonii]